MASLQVHMLQHFKVMKPSSKINFHDYIIRNYIKTLVIQFLFCTTSKKINIIIFD